MYISFTWMNGSSVRILRKITIQYLEKNNDALTKRSMRATMAI